jgi:hypothetical protein
MEDRLVPIRSQLTAHGHSHAGMVNSKASAELGYVAAGSGPREGKRCIAGNWQSDCSLVRQVEVPALVAQRLLWAGAGTKDPKASDVLSIKARAAPFTVNTMREGTLKALPDHDAIDTILPADGGDCEEIPDQFAKAGINVSEVAAQLQDEGAKSFIKSWNDLMDVIEFSSAALRKVS